MAAFTTSTPFTLPTHLRRNASWPPMSARHLPSLAAVHFHLAPGKQQQQQQQSANRHSAPLSSSSSYTTSSMSSSSRQRRSWPREQELPDIDEDPFAHFLSPMTEEELESPFADHDDALSFSAGIIVSDDEGVGDDAKDEEKSGVRGLWGDGATRDKLRSGLARRWAKYVGRWYDGGGGDGGGGEPGGDDEVVGEEMQTAPIGEGRGAAGARIRRRSAPPPGLHQIEEDRDAEMEEEARAMEREMERNMAVDEGYMSEEVVAEKKKASQQQQQQRPKRPGPDTLVMSQQPYRAVVREPTKGRAQDLVDGRMSKRRKYRHSWRAPDRDLFTVVEEQAAEGGDASEIELPYFSAF
ncbi:uncharacterized protein J3D65DRAFT_603168 [Phyllosticta citribraziliensis]|uniref:Uncharacterized protein n=1 Tax=Phyllosticta citribraziliensis TaxID=989973 RepID=A0ABR1LQW1_9PEZI